MAERSSDTGDLRQRRLDTLARIADLLTRTELDVTATAKVVVEIISSVVDADCAIARLSSDGEWMEVLARYWRDAAMESFFASVQRWPSTIGSTAIALRERRSVRETVNRINADEAPVAYQAMTSYAPSSVVMVPLLVDDAPLGVLISMRRTGEAAMTSDDVTLLGEVASSIALFLATAARRAETVTVRSRLAAITDALPSLVSFVDKDERYQYVNAAYERWFGVPREQYIGRTMREMLGDGYAAIEDSVRAVLGGKTVRFETRAAYPSGTRDIDAQYVPFRTNDTVDGFAVLVSDTTGEKRATARLQSLLALTTRIAAARTTDEIATALVDGGRDALETLAASMWQLGDGEAHLVRSAGTLSQPIEVGQRIPLASIEPVADCLRTKLPVWVTTPEEISARYPDLATRRVPGREAPIAFALLPLVTEHTTSCIGFSFRDDHRLSADDRTYLEILASHGTEALRRAEAMAELQRHVQTEQRARADAEAASRAKDEFLAMLGHELRNPLAPMVTALELMRLRGETAFPRERAVFERQVQHLSRLVDDLLDVSRITRSKIELRRETVALGDVIAKAVEQTSPLFDERRHALTVDVPGDLVVHADSTRLAQVFANLLSNAAKYTPRGGTVDVTAAPVGDVIRIAVRDNGVGMPASLVPHVFELFVQAPQPSERPAGGLGLGLAIVRSLVELHGGEVTVTSEGPGRGCEFVVTLPSAVPLSASQRVKALRVTKAGSSRRVLVVDDNEDAALMLADMLDAYGHEIRTAFDGPTALKVADEFQPEVAVLDLGLPVMDGYELAAKLRAWDGDLRLIAVTGYGQDSDRKRSLEAGFAAHLAKPVEIETLVQLVEKR